ncbi:MAG TPA: hypothetical protein VFY40_27175 [Blastocatellia bacterium]|nr:hypothetical protein [Blastocatellia bacterium]
MKQVIADCHQGRESANGEKQRYWAAESRQGDCPSGDGDKSDGADQRDDSKDARGLRWGRWNIRFHLTNNLAGAVNGDQVGSAAGAKFLASRIFSAAIRAKHSIPLLAHMECGIENSLKT